MDDSVAKLQMAIYEDYAAPEEFFAVARRLEAAAMTLQLHHAISKNSNQAFEDRAQEFMLWGFCIEDLMKGLFARKKHREGGSITKQSSKGVTEYAACKTHDLNKIADQISFTRDQEERLALQFFSKAVVYFGRYPLPLSSRDLAVYWDDRFDVLLKSLLTRLKKEAVM